MRENKNEKLKIYILLGVIIGTFFGIIAAGTTYLILNSTDISLLNQSNGSHNIVIESFLWIISSIAIVFSLGKLKKSLYLTSSLFGSYILSIAILNYLYNMYFDSLPYDSLPNIELTIIIFISLIIGIFVESAGSVLAIFTKKIET